MQILASFAFSTYTSSPISADHPVNVMAETTISPHALPSHVISTQFMIGSTCLRMSETCTGERSPSEVPSDRAVSLHCASFHVYQIWSKSVGSPVIRPVGFYPDSHRFEIISILLKSLINLRLRQCRLEYGIQTIEWEKMLCHRCTHFCLLNGRIIRTCCEV